MPKVGDTFTISLKETHLGWGTHRYTDTRSPIPRECYIPIPSCDARRIGIYNSNYTNNEDIIGTNIFKATSSDGYFCDRVKSSGNSKAGDKYAKNLSGAGNLKAFSDWFRQMNVCPGTQIQIEWTSPIDILFTIL
ncbi:hypothetical protein NND30_09570 [Streptococcus mutans]|uniref:hypothetical protein n=1 Tax=Streptococcus mutans TaxID=1309 RepID=UPI0002B59F95|nr:hypothetical protein [Streptococcus mutans]EMB63231.1 hypothetical protein SMU22_09317 [Streptococcus mutans 4SM1]EMC49935.1 hypothetical protein SMU103_02266 [Streptococcus mutans SA38]MDT9524594.1 hypothetical protein [Streptococcus mutans]MDT9526443.1 hypothetical protein [Streptococcus mutans]MDT9528288.1 hypothetical protein [Streptococcus mutans]